MYRLRVVEGAMSGEVYPLRVRTILGRSADADIQLVDRGISRQHCCILEDDTGQLVLVDLSSANGTRVDGEKVERADLSVGSRIVLGEIALVLEQGARMDDDESMSIKLASGPAEEDTAVTDPIGCGDPLHMEALARSWKHCPACGETT